MDLTDLAFIDDTGYHFSDYPTFLQWVQDQYRSIYGADVYIEPDSQDGQFLSIIALSFYQMAALGGSVFNSFSPATAQGVGLSRLVKINGLNRRSATSSIVDVLIVGQAGTVLGTDGNPAMAVDTLDQKWVVPVGTTIPGGGSITVTVTAQDAGAVQAAANTVNRIFTPTRGWQTVNNAAQATAGVAAETDAELRARQAISTSNPSLTVFDGTVGAIANLTGVIRVRGYENDTASTDGNGIPSHSISCVVEGGDVTEICQTILDHKTPGCGTYGDTSAIVEDAHGMPLLIKFQRQVNVPITAEVVISVNPGYTAAYADLITAAIANAINAVGIGSDVLYTKLFIAAYLQGSPAFGTFDVVSVQISRDSDPVAPANVSINWDELPTCDTSDVTVVT